MHKTIKVGRSGILFEEGIPVLSHACAGGSKESAGPLGNYIDIISDDNLFGAQSFLSAESAMQLAAANKALSKAGLTAEDMDFCFAGDLLAQESASNFGAASLNIPFAGFYGACSTSALTLSFGAMLVAAGYASNTLCVISSHFATAEKEFRFPLDYGSQRPLSASWTVTGAAAFVLGGEQASNIIISGLSIGKITDFDIKDPQNMGACMAPAAADLIQTHLNEFSRKPEDYDAIYTGDLGSIGSKALKDLLMERGVDISAIHFDCGNIIYDEASQDTHAGGSGCGCSALVLGTHIFNQLKSGIEKRVLFVPTGALLSKSSSNEGKSIPGVAHGVVFEAK